MAGTYNFTVYQGDNYNLYFTVSGDYSAYTHKMAIAIGLEATTATILLEEGTGITQSYDAVTGKTTCVASLSAAQSAGLDAERIYFYDYQVVSGSNVLTLLAGTIAVTPQVTEG